MQSASGEGRSGKRTQSVVLAVSALQTPFQQSLSGLSFAVEGTYNRNHQFIVELSRFLLGYFQWLEAKPNVPLHFLKCIVDQCRTILTTPVDSTSKEDERKQVLFFARLANLLLQLLQWEVKVEKQRDAIARRPSLASPPSKSSKPVTQRLPSSPPPPVSPHSTNNDNNSPSLAKGTNPKENVQNTPPTEVENKESEGNGSGNSASPAKPAEQKDEADRTDKTGEETVVGTPVSSAPTSPSPTLSPSPSPGTVEDVAVSASPSSLSSTSDCSGIPGAEDPVAYQVDFKLQVPRNVFKECYDDVISADYFYIGTVNQLAVYNDHILLMAEEMDDLPPDVVAFLHEKHLLTLALWAEWQFDAIHDYTSNEQYWENYQLYKRAARYCWELLQPLLALPATPECDKDREYNLPQKQLTAAEIGVMELEEQGRRSAPALFEEKRGRSSSASAFFSAFKSKKTQQVNNKSLKENLLQRRGSEIVYLKPGLTDSLSTGTSSSKSSKSLSRAVKSSPSPTSADKPELFRFDSLAEGNEEAEGKDAGGTAEGKAQGAGQGLLGEADVDDEEPQDLELEPLAVLNTWKGGATVLKAEMFPRVRWFLQKWAEMLDGLLVLKRLLPAVDIRDAPRLQCRSLVKHFGTAYIRASLVDPGLTLRPVIALALGQDQEVKLFASQIMDLLAREATGDLQQQAQHNLEFVSVLDVEEQEQQTKWCTDVLRSISSSRIQKDLARSHIPTHDLVKHWTVLRNILYFEYGKMLPLPFQDCIVKKTERSAESRRATEKRVLRRKLEVATSKMQDEQFAAEVVKEDPWLHYTDREVIGSGGFGEVYSAKVRLAKGNKAKPDMVAIKSVKASSKSDVAIVKREILTMDACHSSHLVRYHRAFESEERIWLVMEYCDGGTLREFCQSNALTEPDIAYICREILMGLQYMHMQHRIHRDLKPENVLLHLSGDVKLADFGLTIDFMREKLKTSMAGTPCYIAPEMIKNEGYSTKLDIWSFGILIIEMCDGRPPQYKRPTIQCLFNTACYQAPTVENPQDWSVLFNNFLQCCLNKDPNQRLSATELLKHPFIRLAKTRDGIRQLFGHVFTQRALAAAGLF